jgi:hypothetical protein
VVVPFRIVLIVESPPPTAWPKDHIALGAKYESEKHSKEHAVEQRCRKPDSAGVAAAGSVVVVRY